MTIALHISEDPLGFAAVKPNASKCMFMGIINQTYDVGPGPNKIRM